MDSPSEATVATSAAEAAEAATEAAAVAAAIAASAAAIAASVAAIAASLAAIAASVAASGAAIAASVAALAAVGNGGLSCDSLSETSLELNSLMGGSLGGESSSEMALLTDELSLLETNNGCLAFTTWDGLAAAESLNALVGSAAIKASSDEAATELLKSLTS